MNEEDLTDALRRVLRDRASAIRPGSVESTETIRHLPTGSARRRQLRLAWVGTGVAAAVVAALVGISTTRHQGHNIRTRVATPSGTTQPAPGTTSAPETVTSSTIPPTSVAPAAPAPAGLVPLSVSFISADAGWVLGEYPCGSGWCPWMGDTSDGGTAWSATAAPALTVAGSPVDSRPVSVRFADPDDGWVYSYSQLWSTHDGGTTWKQQSIPGGPGAAVSDLEVAAGSAYMAVFTGTAGLGIYSTPAARDSWSASSFSAEMGAGPVPASSIVLQGRTGWLLQNDRTVVSGARDLEGAGWASWTPPCITANGTGSLAAASTTDLVALCAEGNWGPPSPGTAAGETWMYRSSDGGNTFSAAGALPERSIGALAVAPGRPDSVVAITDRGLLASFDGGSTWSTVYAGTTGAYSQDDYVGFTSATQAVAVLGTTTGALVVMSHDGGHTWRQLKF